MDLLPTGVTPITAVPTRIRNRPDPGLLVWTAEGRLTRYEIDRLADFVTEQRNPGNEKRIVRLIAEIPLPNLPEEIVFVDTPGLGSLASHGATETLAYLPQCDLGVILVDASSSVQPEDIATLDALRAASVPAIGVISKADLVCTRDLKRLVKYTQDCVLEQLRMEINVAPLSSRSEMAHLLDGWIGNQIGPRVANARRLAQESSQRKAKALAEGVLQALKSPNECRWRLRCKMRPRGIEEGGNSVTRSGQSNRGHERRVLPSYNSNSRSSGTGISNSNR